MATPTAESSWNLTRKYPTVASGRNLSFIREDVARRNPDEAVFRAIKEELGSIFNGDAEGQRIKLLRGTYNRTVEERNSMSYPGLLAHYALHSVDATVQGLTEEDFCTEKEYKETQRKIRRKHALSEKL